MPLFPGASLEPDPAAHREEVGAPNPCALLPGTLCFFVLFFVFWQRRLQLSPSRVGAPGVSSRVARDSQLVFPEARDLEARPRAPGRLTSVRVYLSFFCPLEVTVSPGLRLGRAQLEIGSLTEETNCPNVHRLACRVRTSTTCAQSSSFCSATSRRHREKKTPRGDSPTAPPSERALSARRRRRHCGALKL